MPGFISINRCFSVMDPVTLSTYASLAQVKLWAICLICPRLYVPTRQVTRKTNCRALSACLLAGNECNVKEPVCVMGSRYEA